MPKKKTKEKPLFTPKATVRKGHVLVHVLVLVDPKGKIELDYLEARDLKRADQSVNTMRQYNDDGSEVFYVPIELPIPPKKKVKAAKAKAQKIAKPKKAEEKSSKKDAKKATKATKTAKPRAKKASANGAVARFENSPAQEDPGDDTGFFEANEDPGQ